MTITVTVTKGNKAGLVKTFTGAKASVKAANWSDKRDNEYGAMCTAKKYDFNN